MIQMMKKVQVMATKRKPNKLFDCLNAINMKNPSYKYCKKDVNGYMLLMWFSHSQSCSDIVNEINKYLFDIPDEFVYTYLYKSIPKARRFIKWDKGVKDKKLLKREEKIVKGLMDVYSFSKLEALTLFKRYIKQEK